MSVNTWKAPNAWVGGGVVDIPKLSRGTYQDMSVYLNSTGSFNSLQINQIIVEWLNSEGITGSQFNDLFYKYWGSLGFTGGYNDRWRKWLDSA